MSNVAIRVEGLGKQYRIGVKEEREDTLVGSLSRWVRSPLANYRNLRKLSRFAADEQAEDVIWALRDVSFEISPGEAVGLIGRNGAGKSTLLKILSRITEPSAGEAVINGRVASLLEVGTGFHPELTGRENVYLNATLLGMSKAEVNRKFDEIVAFSEIEQFIDTPIKRYSSGMKVRLAFSVAAHLEPEILLVDEVLAVGDAAFQRKCLGKMEDVAGEGRTVVFVSHHMSMIQALCTRGVVLTRGGVVFDGPVDAAVGEYLRQIEGSAADPFGDNPDRSGTGAVRFTGVRLLDEGGDPVSDLVAGCPVTLEFDYLNPGGVRRAEVVFTIYNSLGAGVTTVNFSLTGFEVDQLAEMGTIRCSIARLPLVPGRYRLAAALDANGARADHIPTALLFDVASSVFFPTGRTPNSKNATFMLDHEWQHDAGIPALR